MNGVFYIAVTRLQAIIGVIWRSIEYPQRDFNPTQDLNSYIQIILLACWKVSLS